MKKILIIILFLSIYSCGYSPIYTSNDIKFKINQIEINGDKKVNKFILKQISRLRNNSSNNIYDLNIFSSKEINSISKDIKGNTKTFEMVIETNIEIKKNDKIIKEKTFSESFNYNNTSNKFDLSQYERDIQENLIDKIVDNIIFTFDTLNDS